MRVARSAVTRAPPCRPARAATPTRSAPSCNGSARCSATFAISTCCLNACRRRRQRSIQPTMPLRAGCCARSRGSRTRAPRAPEGARRPALRGRCSTSTKRRWRHWNRARAGRHWRSSPAVRPGASATRCARSVTTRSTNATTFGSAASERATRTSSQARSAPCVTRGSRDVLLGSTRTRLSPRTPAGACAGCPGGSGTRRGTADRTASAPAGDHARAAWRKVWQLERQHQVTRVRAASGLVVRRRRRAARAPAEGTTTGRSPRARPRTGRPTRECALREVREEAGLRCEARLGGPERRVPRLEGGELVRWWSDATRRRLFTPTEEVDEVRWVACDAACRCSATSVT